MKISLDNLVEFLEYSDDSPSGLYWKKDNTGINGRKYHSKGGVAGFIKDSGTSKQQSWVIIINKVRYYVHRIIFLVNGTVLTKEDVVDHLDGNPLNNKIENLRVTSQSTNMRNAKQSSANSTGVTGVSYTHRTNKHPVYIATWYETTGKLKTKEFSTYGYGEKTAFRLACEYRQKMIAELNLQGAGYTERHGT